MSYSEAGPSSPAARSGQDGGESVERQMVASSSAIAPGTINGSADQRAPLTDATGATAHSADEPKKVLPPVRKRKMDKRPKGILKPAPPPSKAFSFRRDVLQQINSRLAQQGVNVQVPVPPAGGALGALSETAQEAGSILGGMFKRVSSLATGAAQSQEEPTNARQTLGGRDTSAERGRGTASDMGSPQIDKSVSDTPSTSTNNLPQPSASARPLRRVRFSPANMSVIYPISGSIAPSDEDATRLRIEREHRKRMQDRLQKQWTVYELEALYRECCRMREEHPLKKMRSVFQGAAQNTQALLKTIDLSFVPLDRHAIEPIADLLMVDFGLQKLVLENCGLTDDGVKSIMHALLVSGTLPNLSLASNKRIKYHGWRYVGIYMRRAKALKYLDLSENSINKASLEHIIGALGPTPTKAEEQAKTDKEVDESGEESLTVRANLLLEETDETSSLSSLRLENCGLKTASLDMLALNVRTSQLCHLSLRRNRINAMGAVALALMLKDYPDQLAPTAEQATLTPDQSFTANAPYAVRTSPRMPDAEFGPTNDGSPMPKRGFTTLGNTESPRIVSSPGGGVTRRTMPPAALESLRDATNSPMLTDEADRKGSGGRSHMGDNAESAVQLAGRDRAASEEAARALAQAKRAKRILSSMPRTGHLLTLDLKSNDIRAGVTYLSQALKKNRTLKVLNLSDNGIEVAGLVALADALKYNSTLETLDVSRNPCCGPGLEGITTLRTAFALDSNLKRLFLSDTDLSSQGAIALAEFLPEAKSLIHLDLTENLQIDIAGVMALAVSVKMNKSLRCLDLNIPPNAPDFARLSQDILSSCVRNTEYAQRRAQQRGLKAPIAAPIYKSTLARAAKEKEERARLREATRDLEIARGISREGNTPAPRSREAIQAAAARTIDAANECNKVLRELLTREREQEKERLREREAPRRPDGTIERQLSDYARDLLGQSKQLRGKLRHLLGIMEEGENLMRALQANEDLESLLQELKDFYDGQTDAGDIKPQEQITPVKKGKASLSHFGNRLGVPTSPLDDGLSSPNFSIGSDDEDEEAPPIRRRGAAESPLAKAGKELVARGLGIDPVDTDEPEVKAAREIPADGEAELHDDDGEAEVVNTKARGQLSEEGEIFRRAKSLSIAEEEDEQGEDKSALPEAAANTQANATNLAATPELRIDTAKSSELTSPELDLSRKSPSPNVMTSPIEDRSGEELRRELLNQEVPRKTSIGSANGTPTSPLAFFQSASNSEEKSAWHNGDSVAQ